MECKNCGTTNQDNAKFCSGCGADLSLQNAGEGLDANAQQQAYTAPQQNQNYTQAPNYQAPNYNQGQPQGYGFNAAPVADPGNGMAIAAMVLGIVSFFCFPAITVLLVSSSAALQKVKAAAAAWLLPVSFAVPSVLLFGFSCSFWASHFCLSKDLHYIRRKSQFESLS